MRAWSGIVCFALGHSVVALRRKSHRSDAAQEQAVEGIVKNSFPSNWPYLSHCVRPHGKGGLYDTSVPACTVAAPPFTKDRNIAIVGGGPAGVSMARLLHDRGYKHITIYEKSGRIGGKSKNFMYKGEAHDLGTCYTAGKYECIEAWADDVGLTESVIDVDRSITSETTPSQSDPSKMLSPPNYGSLNWWMAMKSFGMQREERNPRTWAQSFETTFKAAGQRYMQEWMKTMRSAEYMFPTSPDFEALNQTFLSWLEERDLTVLSPRLYISTGGQGYGQLDSMPALYGLMWNHPNLLSGLGTHSMIREGFETLWQRLLVGTDVNIMLNQDIQTIDRRSKRIAIAGSGEQSYDFLIMASPMPDALEMVDYTDEEFGVFNTFYHHELVATILLEQSKGNVLPDPYELFTWGDNVNVQTDITRRTYTRGQNAHNSNTDQIDGKDGPMTIRNTYKIKNFKNPVIGTLQISSLQATDGHLKQLVVDALAEFSVRAKVLKQERWPTYMPHLNLTQIIDERIPWKIWEMQGSKDTWWVGSYASFESVADVLDYNIQLVNTHLCEPQQDCPWYCGAKTCLTSGCKLNCDFCN